MSTETQVLVREMLPDERGVVEELFGRSLGPVDRLVFQLSFEDALRSAGKHGGGNLVGTFEGGIVGSVSMRIILIGRERTGFIGALVTDPEMRGRGVGRSLVDGAISWLEERECDAIYATADRYNSPSWNIFVHRGFSVYEFPRQLDDYGLNFPRLWLGEFHFIGFGTFFLRRDGEEERPREGGEATHLVTAWLGLTLMLWLHSLRLGQSASTLAPMFIVAGLSLLAHELPQKMVGRHLGLETIFKAWEPGVLLGVLLGAIGSIFPAYGSTYVRQLDWRYDPRERGMGAFFAIGPLASLTLASVFWTLSTIASSGLLVVSLRAGFSMNLMNVVFNLLPVQAAGGFVWDGRKILTWSKAAWFALLAGTVALAAIDILF